MVAKLQIVKPGTPVAAPAAVPATERDLRLDLFRGVALWLIFLRLVGGMRAGAPGDHHPDSW